MPPRFRTLVWRELPPCARRICLAWSRRFFHAELFLGQLYQSWTNSPTWNFVGIVGTLGILLTILLFFAPWPAEPLSAAASLADLEQKPAWEVDSRLLTRRTEREPAYQVEFLFDGTGRKVRESAGEIADEVPSRRRRRSSATDGITPPDLSWDVEIVALSRRMPRDTVIADTTWTGRSESPTATDERNPFSFGSDDWHAIDPARSRHRRRSHADESGDHQTVGGALDELATGTTWEPLASPETAPSLRNVALNLSWKSSASRRQRGPQLHLHNDGGDAIARIDVVTGLLRRIDWSQPGDFLAQSVSELEPGGDESVRLETRRAGEETVSILVTAFVGSSTDVQPAVAEAPRPKPLQERLPAPAPITTPEPPRDRPAPVREVERPHLTMTIGEIGRLPLDNMISAPIRVVNDGNVTLYDVVIVAEVPETLRHEYGSRVHYQLRQMAAGEERRATLLLTPLEAGSSTVPLHAYDGNRRAEDRGTVRIRVGERELAERPEDSLPPRAPRRHRDENTFGTQPTETLDTLVPRRKTEPREFGGAPEPVLGEPVAVPPRRRVHDTIEFGGQPNSAPALPEAPRRKHKPETPEFGSSPESSLEVSPLAPRKRHPQPVREFGNPPADAPAEPEAPRRKAKPNAPEFGKSPESSLEVTPLAPRQRHPVPKNEFGEPPVDAPADRSDFGSSPETPREAAPQKLRPSEEKSFGSPPDADSPTEAMPDEADFGGAPESPRSRGPVAPRKRDQPLKDDIGNPPAEPETPRKKTKPNAPEFGEAPESSHELAPRRRHPSSENEFGKPPAETPSEPETPRSKKSQPEDVDFGDAPDSSNAFGTPPVDIPQWTETPAKKSKSNDTDFGKLPDAPLKSNIKPPKKRPDLKSPDFDAPPVGLKAPASPLKKSEPSDVDFGTLPKTIPGGDLPPKKPHDAKSPGFGPPPGDKVQPPPAQNKSNDGDFGAEPETTDDPFFPSEPDGGDFGDSPEV